MKVNKNENAKEKENQIRSLSKKEKQTKKNKVNETNQAKEKRFWTTKEMAEDFDREDILRSTLRDFLIYALFLTFVTIYATGIRNRAMFYLTTGLSQQFTDKSFTTVNNVEITFEDIRTASDVWFYLENHLVKSLYWEYAYTVGKKKKMVDENAMNILGENKILGVPRIRQVRMSNDSCVIHEYFRRLFLSCFAKYSSTSEDRKPFGLKTGTAWVYKKHQETKSLPYSGKISTYGGGGFYTDLVKTRNGTQEIIKTLKDNLWITQGTRAIFVDFSVYNGNVNLFAACKLIFEFPAIGGVIPSTSINSMTLIRFQNRYDYFVFACECCFYVFILFYIIEEIRDFTYFRWGYFTKFWTYVDLTIIILSVINAIASIYKVLNVPSSIETIQQNSDKYGNLEQLTYAHNKNNDILAIDLFLIYIKVFKFLNFNRTMGQLNNTLKKCAWDIAGFSLMFFIVFFAFAELGYLLFGDKVENFSHFGLAMFTLLRTILGDFDYSELSQANPILAPIFFISYIFLVFFVLLNMFLAIINDTYSDVKTEIAIAPDEMQMTEYLKNCFNTLFKKCGCNVFSSSTKEKKGEINATIRHIREALKKCDFSDLEIEMFFARYNIHPLADIHIHDVDKLKDELESLIRESDNMANFVKLEDFLDQQEKLAEMETTLSLLVEQVKNLLQKLEEMEIVRKEGLIKK